MSFKNKKFYLIGTAVIFIGLPLLLNASPALATGCHKTQIQSYFSSFSQPLASLAEKTMKSFGYDVALATAPDPDFCGSDSVVCVGGTPQATIAWNAAFWPSYYLLTVSGVSGSPFNTGLANSYTISSGLANNTTYTWSVEAYFTGGLSSASLGYTGQPYGSFTTPNCALPSCQLCNSVSGTTGQYQVSYDGVSFTVNSPRITVTWNAIGPGSRSIAGPPFFSLNGVRQQYDWVFSPLSTMQTFVTNLNSGNNQFQIVSDNGRCDYCGVCDGVWAKITFADGTVLYTDTTWAGASLPVSNWGTPEGRPYLNTITLYECNMVSASKSINVQPILADSRACAAPSTAENCLSSSASAARISWSYSSTNYPQAAFYAQIDDNADFSSPEVNTGWTPSGLNYYDVPGSSLQPNTTYYWRVQIKNTNNQVIDWVCDPNNKFTTAGLCSSVPNAPSGLTATVKSCGLIGLSWIINSNNEQGFKIERRKLGESSWTQIDATGGRVNGYADKVSEAGVTYQYQIKAYNSSGDSAYSNMASAGPSTPICYNIVVSKTGTGAGTVTADHAGQFGTNINCGSSCNALYNSGDSVILTGTASTGGFSGWTVNGSSSVCSGIGACTLAMDSDKAVVASFMLPDFTLSSSNNIYATVVNAKAGDSSATTLTVTPIGGFSSTVNLSVQSVSPSLPAGSTFSFSPASLTSSQYSSGSQFKVHIGAGLTASRQYTITIQGIDGGLVRTATILLNAQVANPQWKEF